MTGYKWQAASAESSAAMQKTDRLTPDMAGAYYSTDMPDCHPIPQTGPLPCDAHHHYYHYQSSTQYLWLASTLQILGQKDEAKSAYNKAIFQDHFNQDALEGRNRLLAEIYGEAPSSPITYAKHPVLDADFCTAIDKPHTPETEPHDHAHTLYETGAYTQTLASLPQNEHSNSRFLRGKCLFMLGHYEQAAQEFREAIRLSHIDHDAYHRFASAQHYTRAQQWLTAGDMELAISGLTKALDLYSGNKEARRLRAETYRRKGNIRLAEQDEIESL